MLNIKGGFLVIGARNAPPFATLLGADELERYYDRVSVVGFDKANAFQFGEGTLAAIPTSEPALYGLLPDSGMHREGYSGPWAKEVHGLAACIVTGTPIGGARDLGDKGPEGPTKGDGGTKVKAQPKPRKPSPSNSVPLSQGAA